MCPTSKREMIARTPVYIIMYNRHLPLFTLRIYDYSYCFDFPFNNETIIFHFASPIPLFPSPPHAHIPPSAASLPRRSTNTRIATCFGYILSTGCFKLLKGIIIFLFFIFPVEYFKFKRLNFYYGNSKTLTHYNLLTTSATFVKLVFQGVSEVFRMLAVISFFFSGFPSSNV